MAAAKIRAIIFDIGRVLVRIDVGRAMAGLTDGTSLSPQELWSALEKDPRWRDWQEGRVSPREWHRHLKQRLGGNLGFEQFSDSWNRALSPEPLIPDSILAELSRRFRLAVLSNTDAIHVAHLEANFSFLQHFPRRIYSCTVGSSKPEPLIYKEALRSCQVRAGEALYIDDIPAYVEAARRLGMEGLQFSGAERLQAELQARGLITTAGDPK